MSVAAEFRQGHLVAGVDVGGTKTSVVVLDDKDAIVYQQVAPTDKSMIVEQIAGLVDDACRELHEAVSAVGVAAPGQVDPEDGSVRMAVNLGITYLPLGLMLATELRIPIFVEHDARAAALWLARSLLDGGGETSTSLAFLAIGTGISAGIVLDGGLLRGDNGLAGEVGHIVVDPCGTMCACGMRGCLETIAAGPAIGRQADDAIAAGYASTLVSPSTASDVFRASAAGDVVAGQIVDNVADYLVRTMRALTLTLGVRRIVIGGGVAAAGAALLDPIRSRISLERAASPLAEVALGQLTVEVLAPTEAAGARGAAAIARRRVGLLEREGVGER